MCKRFRCGASGRWFHKVLERELLWVGVERLRWAVEGDAIEDWPPRAQCLCPMRAGEAFGQKLALGVVPGQLQSLLVGERSLLRAAKAMQQVRLDRR